MPPKAYSVPHDSGGRRTPPNPPPTRKTGLSMSDFQYQGPLEDDSVTTIARGLREKRLRFTKKIPNDHDSDICSPRDRRSALSVFDEAIEKIGEGNRLEVTTEADYKIRVILGITKAQPSASVFQNKQQLAPIDPQYAEPRIEWHDDPYSYHSTWRLQHWRKDGWPDSFPERAIQKERTMQGEPRSWKDQDWAEPGGLS